MDIDDKGRLTGNKVYKFFIYKSEFNTYRLFCLDNFGNTYVKYRGRFIDFEYILIALGRAEVSSCLRDSAEKIKELMSKFYLFTSKAEANEALRIRRDELTGSRNSERLKILKEDLKEVNKRKREIEAEIKAIKAGK